MLGEWVWHWELWRGSKGEMSRGNGGSWGLFGADHGGDRRIQGMWINEGWRWGPGRKWEGGGLLPCQGCARSKALGWCGGAALGPMSAAMGQAQCSCPGTEVWETSPRGPLPHGHPLAASWLELEGPVDAALRIHRREHPEEHQSLYLFQARLQAGHPGLGGLGWGTS